MKEIYGIYGIDMELSTADACLPPNREDDLRRLRLDYAPVKFMEHITHSYKKKIQSRRGSIISQYFPGDHQLGIQFLRKHLTAFQFREP